MCINLATDLELSIQLSLSLRLLEPLEVDLRIGLFDILRERCCSLAGYSSSLCCCWDRAGVNSGVVAECYIALGGDVD